MALIFATFLWPPEPLLQYACARAQSDTCQCAPALRLEAVPEGCPPLRYPPLYDYSRSENVFNSSWWTFRIFLIFFPRGGGER